MKEKSLSSKKKWIKPEVKQLKISSQTANGMGMGMETYMWLTMKWSNGSYQ